MNESIRKQDLDVTHTNICVDDRESWRTGIKQNDNGYYELYGSHAAGDVFCDVTFSWL